MKLLYAEDEKALSMAVAEILKMEGFDVDAVYSGDEAYNSICNGTYDGIILDIMMPGMSGLEVLEKIRGEGNYTPIILLTAKTQVDDRINGLSKGADDYLAKPFDLGELVARVNAMIRRTIKYGKPSMQIGNITLDRDNNKMVSPFGALALSSKEVELLEHLINVKEEGSSSQDIMQHLWPEEEDGATAVLYLTYLKNKLKQLRADIVIRKKNDIFYIASIEDSI